jgi:NADPH-dependent ferric siderophore reductase
MAANWQRGVLKALGVKNHPVEVVGVTDITPWYRRVRLSAPGFFDTVAVHPTLWVRLWVSDPEKGRLVQRGYTVVDPRPETHEFSLDFVLHEPTGPAAAWAKSLRVGDRAEVAHTTQRLTIPPEARTLVLVGDSTAVPAIVTLLESAPDDADVHVVIHDEHPDRASLPLPAERATTLTWVDADRDGTNAVAAIAGSTDGVDADGVYLWAAGERHLVKAVREHARTAWGLPRERQHAQNYWIRGHSVG